MTPAARLVTVLLVTFTGLLTPAEAEQARTPARVGFILPARLSEIVGPEPGHPLLRRFIGELRGRGWVEGRNLVLERRTVEKPSDPYADIVSELLGLGCDVIITTSTEMAREARRVTATVPIVMWAIGDPVAAGLVTSLGRPGGNLTGVMTRAAHEDEDKRLELLKELLPKNARVAILEIRGAWDSRLGERQRAAAAALGITLTYVDPAPEYYGRALDHIARDRPDGVLVGPTPFLDENRHRIVELMLRLRLPLVSRSADLTEAGALMSYGASTGEYARRLAGQVDRILRGAHPGDLPIEGPATPELVINLKTARALGLTVPPSVLRRADRVIR